MYNNFVVEGEKSVLELLRDPSIVIESVIGAVEWLEQHESLLPTGQEVVYAATPKVMGQISSLKTPSRIIAVAQQLPEAIDQRVVKNNLSLYLDRIQNPGNLGTIIRIADWFGIPYVFCSPGCADLYNPKTLQSTMGAFLRVKVIQKAFADMRADFPDLPVYGTVLEGKSIFKTPLSDTGLIVIGSEGQGISEDIRQDLTHPIAIPADPAGGGESLNAAVATGIVCALFKNQ